MNPTKTFPPVCLEDLPQRIRDMATLRGLGYSFREISKQLEVSPQAVSLALTRHRRVLKSLSGAVDLAKLSTRAVNVLSRHRIKSRAEARKMDLLARLQGERNCGKKTREEILRWLHDGGPAPHLSAGREISSRDGAEVVSLINSRA